jgi:hypothetical protein
VGWSWGTGGQRKKQMSNFVPETETDISVTDNTTNRRTNRHPMALKYYKNPHTLYTKKPK